MQQDADEFLTYILDYLETKCGYKPFTAWLDILQGGVTSSIKCEKCGKVTSTVDPFMVLKIKFQPSCTTTAVNITDLLTYNFAQEQLVDENQFDCQQCKNTKQDDTKQDATKTLLFSLHPPTLLVSFARFNLNVYTGVNTKISTPVNFGRTLQFQDNVIYNLIGIIIHDGRTDVSGHYYAYLQLGHSWFVVNDQDVRSASDDEVDIVCTGQHRHGVTPYILSYRRTALS